MNKQASIPFHIPSIGEEEIRDVEAVLRSGWLTTGPRTAQFEKDFGAYVGAPHAVAVNSCTAALHIALAALDIGEGDEVITTPLTFCSTVHTILHTGARAVMADIGTDGNIDPDAIAAALTPNTRAIIPVHLAGLPCDMDRIWELARKHDLSVIEDAAHAAGTHYRGRSIGDAGDVANASDVVAFSFYATKNMTTGEGGMATSPNEQLASRMRMFSLHGLNRDAWNRYSDKGNWYYEVCEPGFKYNLTDLQSAIGIQQLKKLEGFVETRARYARIYHDILENVEEVELPPDAQHPGDRHAWHLYTLRLNLERLKIDRAAFIEEMRQRGVSPSVHFIPIPVHPYFAKLNMGDDRCERALDLYPRLVSLPLYPAMTEADVVRVAECVRDIAKAHRKRASVTLPETRSA